MFSIVLMHQSKTELMNTDPAPIVSSSFNLCKKCYYLLKYCQSYGNKICRRSSLNSSIDIEYFVFVYVNTVLSIKPLITYNSTGISLFENRCVNMVLSQVFKCGLVYRLFIEINCFRFSTKWKSVIDRTKDFSNTKIDSNLNYMTEESRKQSNDESCFNDTISFYEGIDQSTQWAIKSMIRKDT